MKILAPLCLALALGVLLFVGPRFILPSILETQNPGVVYRVRDAGKTLYLTLDDGPSEATAKILDILKKHDVPATFFVITDHINAGLMHRISAEGHQIGNHMRTSASIARMPLDRFRAEFLDADAALAPFTKTKFFRPPNGSVSSDQAALVKSRGYQVVVGTIFPLDHWLTNTTAIATLAKLLVTDGGIVILHDTRERGPRTAAILDELIPYLKRRGYTFALLPENIT